MWLRSRVPRYWPSFTRCVSFYRGSISLSAPPCDARVALDGFVHLRRFASRSRQLAAAQPGCPSLDPHATCSEARPQSLATPQLVSIFSSRCTVWRQDRPSLSAGIGARARREAITRRLQAQVRARRARSQVTQDAQLRGAAPRWPKTVAQGRLRRNRCTPCGAYLLRLSTCCPKLLAYRTRSRVVWLVLDGLLSLWSSCHSQQR